jgi:2-polyprenyl-3-methyl-5-hydroxy-6-metoxy-1,4-benzoquinol methylase
MAILLAVTGIKSFSISDIKAEHRMDMSTDIAWEEWGRRDPYFGVITDPKFRSAGINENAKQEFFASGEVHVNGVLSTIRKYIDPGFVPRAALDFGCGVGRLLIPFARVAQEVVGLDISPSMLHEARRNCDEQGLQNVRLFRSDDALSTLTGSFDLIHSCIVFQHIPVERGRALFARLLQQLSAGGVGAIQLTYAKTYFASTYGLPPPELPRMDTLSTLNSPASTGADPVMQMNPYNLNEILFLMQRRGILRFHAEYTDHGGELGIFLFFQAA